MALEIKTSILINASPSQVWQQLISFESYPTWNPFIKEISGDLFLGSRIKVTIQASRSSTMTFKPLVSELEQQRVLSWLGHLGIKGFFDGLHKFELIAGRDGRTQLIHSEQFTGFLVPFFKKQLQTNTTSGFEAMNQCLKNIVEKKGFEKI
jgi:hypothetical protein